MPPVSERQRRAMEAAAHGHSTLGIPEKVGEEFVSKDDASGTEMAQAPVREILTPKVGDDDLFVQPNDFSAARETIEQHNRDAFAAHFKYADPYTGLTRTFDEKGDYNCGRCNQADGNNCLLVKTKIDRMAGSCGDWENLCAGDAEMHRPYKTAEVAGYGVAQNGKGFGCHRCPFASKAHQPDSRGRDLYCGKGDFRAFANACCVLNGAAVVGEEHAQDERPDWLALDKASVRTTDKDGHLHVARTPISKAVVNGYLGNEIPDWEVLGLDPAKVYNLYRDPAELKKGAASFARKPILIRHTPISADDHPHDLTVGTIGDDVEFDDPFLMAPLTIWDKDAIDLIESGEQRELSCGYRYRPVMVAGTTPDGEPYDGRMTQIEANHLALVSQGRAGPDVVVGDSALPSPPIKETPEMAKSALILSRKAAVAHGAILSYLAPKLAKDAKVDLRMALDGVTAKNFDEKRPAIIDAVKKATAGKLAKDAKLDDIDLALDAAKAADDLPKNGLDEEPSKKAAFLKEKLSAEDWKAYDSMEDDQEAMDEEEKEEESKGKKGAEDEEEEEPKKKGAEDEEEDKVDKKAMDAAITAAVRETEKRVMRTQREIRTAEDEVLPYVGKLAIACDSAADVYKAALGALKVDVAGMHPTAYRPVLLAQPKPGAKQEQRREAPVAMDSAGVASFQSMFPKAKPVHRV